jgi:hypothetical protein
VIISEKIHIKLKHLFKHHCKAHSLHLKYYQSVNNFKKINLIHLTMNHWKLIRLKTLIMAQVDFMKERIVYKIYLLMTESTS